MSKRTPKENYRKRPRFDLYEDTPETDRDAENTPLPNAPPDALPKPVPLSPTTRESRVLQLLLNNLKPSLHRGLTLHLIDRIRPSAHYTPEQILILRAITAFNDEIVSKKYFIPQLLVNTFYGFTEKASKHARLTVLTSNKV